jgi:hypothetical protein
MILFFSERNTTNISNKIYEHKLIICSHRSLSSPSNLILSLPMVMLIRSLPREHRQASSGAGLGQQFSLSLTTRTPMTRHGCCVSSDFSSLIIGVACCAARSSDGQGPGAKHARARVDGYGASLVWDGAECGSVAPTYVISSRAHVHR